MLENRRIRIGLIGLGYWGANYFRVLLNLEGVELKYVCDNDINKLSNYEKLAIAKNIIFLNDVTKIAEDEEIEAVIIATPASTHYELTKMMLESGKHVLVEKPLTMSYKQALELCSLSKKVGKILMVGHIYCYNPAVKFIKDFLSQGNFGDLYYGIGLRLGLGPIRSDASCTWDLATHDVAMLYYILNKLPRYVSAHALAFLQKEKGIYDYANISFIFDNDFQFNLTVSWYAAEKIRIWYLMGSKFMLKFDDMNKNSPITIYNKKVVSSKIQNKTLKFSKFLLKEGAIILPPIQQSEPLLMQCMHFIESIKSGKKPLTDCLHGAVVVRVLEAVEESINNAGALVEVRI